MVSRRVHPAHGPGGLERSVADLVTERLRGVDANGLTPRQALELLYELTELARSSHQDSG